MRSVSSALEPRPTASSTSVVRPAEWSGSASGRSATAVLLVGPGATDGVESLKRCFATALPGADVFPFVVNDRAASVRRLFAEVNAASYVVADQVRDPIAVARAVAAVERDDIDLVVVTALRETAFADMSDHLLALTLDYLFGCGAGPVDAEAVVCSRRFARSYAGDGTALDLALHALRRRMPFDEVGIPGSAAAERPGRTPREWLALAALVARLFAEERPRRTFGVAGIAAMAVGLAAGARAVRIHAWHADVLPGWGSAAALGLIGAGLGALLAGTLLDTMVKARQDVSRIGRTIAASAGDQSSVS